MPTGLKPSKLSTSTSIGLGALLRSDNVLEVPSDCGPQDVSLREARLASQVDQQLVILL